MRKVGVMYLGPGDGTVTVSGGRAWVLSVEMWSLWAGLIRLASASKESVVE